MKVTQVEVSRLFSLGNFQNLKVGIAIELEDNETAKDGINRGMKFINQYDPKNAVSKSEYERAKNVVQNKRSYLIGDVEDAELKIKIYEASNFDDF